MHEVCVSHTGYLTHGNSTSEARGRNRHQNISKRVVRRMEERNVGTNGGEESPEQGVGVCMRVDVCACLHVGACTSTRVQHSTTCRHYSHAACRACASSCSSSAAAAADALPGAPSSPSAAAASAPGSSRGGRLDSGQ